MKQGAIIDIDLSLFNTHFSNKIIPNYDTNPNKIIYANLNGVSTSKGASFNLNIQASRGLSVNLGGTFIDTDIVLDGAKTRPYLTEQFQGVWKFKKKWNSSKIILDFTGSTTGPLKLPRLSYLDPRPNYSPTFYMVNMQLTKTWNN